MKREITMQKPEYPDYLEYSYIDETDRVVIAGYIHAKEIIWDIDEQHDMFIYRKRWFVYRFDMSPQTGALGYGADYHPSRRQANKMAKELSAYLTKITGWK